MIRLGVCASVDQILEAAQAGFEYLEGNLSETALLSPESFATQKALVGEASIKPEVFGCMLPLEMNVTGRGVNASVLHNYLDFAFNRASELGGRIVVFASPGARQVPEDFPIDVAWRQIINFLRIAERHAREHKLTVAVEPVCRNECNLLTTVSEAALLCSVLNLPHVRVLADSYHMAMEHEPLSVLRQTGSLICHAHTANALGRGFPRSGDGERYGDFLDALRQAGYDGRVSVEGVCEDFCRDARAAFEALNAAREPNPIT